MTFSECLAPICLHRASWSLSLDDIVQMVRYSIGMVVWSELLYPLGGGRLLSHSVDGSGGLVCALRLGRAGIRPSLAHTYLSFLLHTSSYT
jgi:hypothetical protein